VPVVADGDADSPDRSLEDGRAQIARLVILLFVEARVLR
jgi:hypothetical protein